VIKREILVDNTLYLYLPEEWKEYLRRSRYQLLLGRSCDLATVDELKSIELDEKENVKIKNTLVPLDLPNAAGVVHALPIEFDYTTIPRRAKIVRPFILATQEFMYPGKTFYDPELGLGVWMYEDKDFS
jgi:CRISPR-associated protein Cas5t